MSWNPSEQEARRAAPSMAVALTWIVPGAGHLYLGRPAFALAAFLVVEGLYLLGLRLSDGMLFEFLQADLRGPFAGVLTPEAANVGMLVYHMRSYGYGPGFPRVWPEHIHLAAWLTAISGFLNACLMVQAHFEARRPTRERLTLASPSVQVLAAWVFPGLGHLLQGRRRRAALVAVVLVGLLVLATLLAEGSNLDRERHFYYWAGQFLAGGAALLLEVVHGHARVTGELPYVDAGLGMGCVAGLLNVLAMIDVCGEAERRAIEGAAAPALPAARAEAAA